MSLYMIGFVLYGSEDEPCGPLEPCGGEVYRVRPLAHQPNTSGVEGIPLGPSLLSCPNEIYEKTHQLPHPILRPDSKFLKSLDPNGTPYQYRIDWMEQVSFFGTQFPVTRTLTVSPVRSIDPPSSRLPVVHRATAIGMKSSSAAEYIEKVLRDLEILDVKEDRSRHLGHLPSLQLDGWVKTRSMQH